MKRLNRLMFSGLATLVIAAPAGATTDVSAIRVTSARATHNFVVATVKNYSSQSVGAFDVYFNIYTRDGKFTETVEASFSGTLRPGASARIKGGIFKSYDPGPAIVEVKEIRPF
ncbi:MAG: hypothetical protein ACLGIN_12230 [Candidatus Sericytochromatia bacterium]